MYGIYLCVLNLIGQNWWPVIYTCTMFDNMISVIAAHASVGNIHIYPFIIIFRNSQFSKQTISLADKFVCNICTFLLKKKKQLRTSCKIQNFLKKYFCSFLICSHSFT